MNGWNYDEVREKVPVTPEPKEREEVRELPQYEGGYDAWRRTTELPRRWRV